jgi:hypothetical protein
VSLADRFGAQARDSRELAGVSDDDLVEVANRAFLESSRRFDPAAALETSLDLHLTGSRVRPGAITFDTAADIFHQIQAEVREAVAPGEDKAAAELELVGLSEGSAIVHARAVNVIERSDQELDFPVPVLDGAIERILDLHDALERSADPGDLARSGTLLDRLRKLTHDLDRHDLSLEMVWRGASGRHRTSTLSERGRARAREIFEKKETGKREQVYGSIYSVSLDGQVTLRVRRNNRTASLKIKEVDNATLSSPRFTLGRYARMEVTAERQADSVGLQETESYRFLRLISVDEELTEPSDD